MLGGRPTPVSRMRRAIIEATTRSAREIPAYRVCADVMVAEVLRLRRGTGAGVKPSVVDAVLVACARALRAVPRLNASLVQDTIVEHDEINLGTVVALPDGLLVPVIRGADRLGLDEMSRCRRALQDAARAGRLRAEEFTGATSPVSNLGPYAVDRFDAMILPPQVGILAVGRAVERPVVVNGVVAARPVMTVTLTADHRVVDGVVAASFLDVLRRYLESPEWMSHWPASPPPSGSDFKAE